MQVMETATWICHGFFFLQGCSGRETEASELAHSEGGCFWGTQFIRASDSLPWHFDVTSLTRNQTNNLSGHENVLKKFEVFD